MRFFFLDCGADFQRDLRNRRRNQNDDGYLEDPQLVEWVQVHPTGLVKISAEDEKIKFLAAEALHSIGGLLIDKNGKRICKELERRGYVTKLMWKK